MNKISALLLTAVIATTCFISSCGKDDDPISTQGNQQIADEQNATEEYNIPTSILETGIKINDATKKSGVPPSPNSDLDFRLNKNRTEAFQRTGLTIELSFSDSISGAYIQFKDVEGNAASYYFDVPVSWFKAVGKEFNREIGVLFGSDIPTGKFCYDMFLYDASNNISPIQTLCVTVEAWGGNASIVGEWKFDRNEPSITGTQIAFCANGDRIEVESGQYVRSDSTFVLNQDGTYFETINDEVKELDKDATVANCSAKYDEVITTYKERSAGNWAYNEEYQTLTVVDFSFENLLDASENQEYDYGRVSFDYGGVKVQVSPEQLVLTDTAKMLKTYFTRK